MNTDTQLQPTILIIAGITGDLSRRYILPAIEQLASSGALPQEFRLVGITRRDMSVKDLCASILTPGPHEYLTQHMALRPMMDVNNVEQYRVLKQELEVMKQEMGKDTKVLFYLPIPPRAADAIVNMLGESGLAESIELVLEKPFGFDLASANELKSRIERYFREDQVYRVDHYLAKEMVQNLLVFRECNALFKRTWNKDFIERIDIIVSEEIGIPEGREAFYEQTGALRDYESHLLQLAALVLMEGADPEDREAVPSHRLQALKQLHFPTDKPLTEYAKRAQVDGYRKQVDNLDSTTETFVDLRLVSDDPNWEGVPIRLVTGKALAKRFTDIVLTYKKEKDSEADALHITVQPDAGISLDLWAKVPGYHHELAQHSLEMVYHDHYEQAPQAYEQVMLDALTGNHSLFVSGDEVLEGWRIIQPVQEAWAASADDLMSYAPGTPVSEVGNKAPAPKK